MKWLAAAAMLVACDRQPAVTSCDDDLRGTWVTDTGARWSVLDYGKNLEAYPAFDDAVPGGAPRVITIERGQKLAGEVRRRFMRRGDACDASAPIRVAKCKDNALQVVIADPQPPLAFAPCAWSQLAASRLERWHRE
jgi:hypothetical protein